MQKSYFFMGVLTTLLILAGIAYVKKNYFSSKTQTGDKISVAVTILPQVEFVKKIGGDQVEVTSMIPYGFNHETYSPTPEQFAQLAKANLYFRIGKLGFETLYMDQLKQMNSTMKVVDTSIDAPWMVLTEHDEHSDHEESADGLDPHIWLSPRLVKLQVVHIYEALIQARPEKEAYFKQNLDAYLQSLDQLDAGLQKAFAPYQGKTLLVYHPAFGYFAKDYGLVQKYIEIEGKEPTLSQVADVIKEAKTSGVKVIFAEKQFNSKTAETIASEIGGKVILIDPIAQDYIQNMENIALEMTMIGSL